MGNDIDSASSSDPPPQHIDHLEHLMKTGTADSVAIPRDLLEKIYLNPPTTPSGNLRKTFANPTPLGVAGLAICALPLGGDLLEWRGAGGQGASAIAVYLFFGGTSLFLTAILEFLLGNSFVFAIFGVYSAFWLSFACTLIPSVNAVASYSPDGSYIKGLMSSEYLASFGFWTTAMATISLIFTIFAMRTNVGFVLALFSITLAFAFITAAQWRTALGDAAGAAIAQKGAGAMSLAVTIELFYLFIALIGQSVDFPIRFPVGDLSWMPSGTSLREKRERKRRERRVVRDEEAA